MSTVLGYLAVLGLGAIAAAGMTVFVAWVTHAVEELEVLDAN